MLELGEVCAAAGRMSVAASDSAIQKRVFIAKSSVKRERRIPAAACVMAIRLRLGRQRAPLLHNQIRCQSFLWFSACKLLKSKDVAFMVMSLGA